MKTILLALAIAAAAQAPTDIAPVLARLDAYMAAYEPRLSELVADERMEQKALVRNLYQRRMLDSEVAFIALKNAGWLGFRHVKSVDAKQVALGTRSLEATLKLSDMQAARELLRASAAHNLGLARTTNLPNLPLEFLHPRNRYRLTPLFDARVMVGPIETSRIVFDEHASPTLISNPRTGADMPSRVTAWIADDGRLLRAEVTTYTSAHTSIYQHLVRVEFVESAALGLLVPSEMYEEFPLSAPQRRGSATATYSNFRKFQTSARIVP
jgi:hypothetical protein